MEEKRGDKKWTSVKLNLARNLKWSWRKTACWICVRADLSVAVMAHAALFLLISVFQNSVAEPCMSCSLSVLHCCCPLTVALVLTLLTVFWSVKCWVTNDPCGEVGTITLYIWKLGHRNGDALELHRKPLAVTETAGHCCNSRLNLSNRCIACHSSLNLVYCFCVKSSTFAAWELCFAASFQPPLKWKTVTTNFQKMWVPLWGFLRKFGM